MATAVATMLLMMITANKLYDVLRIVSCRSVGAADLRIWVVSIALIVVCC